MELSANHEDKSDFADIQQNRHTTMRSMLYDN